MHKRYVLSFTLEELEEALLPWAATPAHKVFIHHAISGWEKELSGQTEDEMLDDLILMAVSTASRNLPAHLVLDYSPVSVSSA